MASSSRIVNETNSYSMLEHETQTIIRSLIDRTIGTAQSIPLKNVLTADIPKNIRQYFQCEVLKWLNHDLQTSSHFSRIETAAPTVRHITRRYTRTIAPEYIFQASEFTNILENAVHFVENYVCRPQWTLEQFVFEQADRVTYPDLQQKFEYLPDYGYFTRLIQEHMRSKQWQEINREHFKLLVRKIDDQVVQRHNSSELAYLSRPVFEFLLQHTIIEGKAIPLRPVIVFFEDKHMMLLKEYIERICQIRGTDQLTIEQLADIIEDLHSGSAATRLREHLPQASTPESSGENEFPDNQSPLPVQEEQPFEHVPTGLPPTPQEQALPVQPNDRRNIPLSLTFTGMTETTHGNMTPLNLPERNYVINEQQRTRFIKSVFQNDEAYYNVVVEALNGMATWRDASLYLEAFYNTSGVDPFDADVVEFTDLIQHRFSSSQ